MLEGPPQDVLWDWQLRWSVVGQEVNGRGVAICGTRLVKVEPILIADHLDDVADNCNSRISSCSSRRRYWLFSCFHWAEDVKIRGLEAETNASCRIPGVAGRVRHGCRVATLSSWCVKRLPTPWALRCRAKRRDKVEKQLSFVFGTHPLPVVQICANQLRKRMGSTLNFLGCRRENWRALPRAHQGRAEVSTVRPVGWSIEWAS